MGVRAGSVGLMRPSALAGAAALAVSTLAHGQVLEIGADGSVKTYAGAAVFTDAGAVAIADGHAPQRRRARHHPVQAAIRLDPAQLARAADAAELSPALVEAVAWRESGLRTDRVSRTGAVGEMQLMPLTARELGVDPADPGQNLKGGAGYLNRMMRRYDGDLMRALAAYNAGPGAVDRYKGVPPYKETQAYVAAVLDRLSESVAPTSAPSSRQKPAS